MATITLVTSNGKCEVSHSENQSACGIAVPIHAQKWLLLVTLSHNRGQLSSAMAKAMPGKLIVGGELQEVALERNVCLCIKWSASVSVCLRSHTEESAWGRA